MLAAVLDATQTAARAKVLLVRSQDRSRRSVAAFYFIAFALSWSIVIPQAAASRGLISVQLPGAVGFLSPLAPMLAAMLMSWREGGTAELKRLLRPLLAWRAAPRWYAVALLGFPLLALVAVVLSFVITGHRPDLSANYIHNVFPQFPRNLSPWLLFLPFLVFSIVTTIPEETGWRGFALPRLQRRWGPLLASLVVGSLWGLWHLPDFYYLQAAQSGISFPLFLAGTVSTSILFTWIFNGTGGSLLIVSILHASFNAGDVFLPLLPQITGTTLQLEVYLALITAVAVTLLVLGRLRGDPSPLVVNGAQTERRL
jgi:membrane protease YdiL (CAAX protease family)